MTKSEAGEAGPPAVEGESPTAPEPKANQGHGNLARRLLVVVLAGVVLYGALVVVRGASKIQAELAHFAWWTFAAACGLSLVNYGFRFLKWEYYLGVLELRRTPSGERAFPVWESWLVFLSGFVLTVTPGKVGEMFKSLVLFEIRGVPMTKTAPIVVAERVTDLVGVIALITIGGSAFPGGLIWAGVGTAFVLLILLVVAAPPVRALLLNPWTRLPGAAGALAKRVVPRVEAAVAPLKGMTSPKHLVVPSLLSVVGWALEGIGVYLIVGGFGSRLDVFRSMFFYATATLAGAVVPIPIGVPEKVLEESMVAIGGVPGPVATATMILARLATLWFAVVVGFVALGLLRMKYPALLARNARSEEKA